MKNVLFVCTRNRLRSPTAEAIFAEHEGIETASAGLNRDADVPVTRELLEWAGIVLVMEKGHRERLERLFRPALRHRRVICLDVPDRYEFMDPELIRILRERGTRTYLKNGFVARSGEIAADEAAGSKRAEA